VEQTYDVKGLSSRHTHYNTQINLK